MYVYWQPQFQVILPNTNDIFWNDSIKKQIHALILV